MKTNIVVVTLSPTIDRVLAVHQMDDRGLACRVECEVAGGKGNNVARVLQRLGCSPRVITAAGGWNGQYFIDLLKQDDIDPIIIPFGTGVRFHTSVLYPDGSIQHLHEPALPYSASDQEVTNWIVSALHSECRPADLVLLCGSTPPGLSPAIYAEIMERCPEFRFGIDTSSKALKSVLSQHPYFIKVNRDELADVVDHSDPLVAASRCVQWGCIVTMGSSGSEAIIESTYYHVFPAKVAAVNPIGAGDAYMAGFTYGMIITGDPETALQWATACAGESTRWSAAGIIDPNQVRRLVKEVRVEKEDGGDVNGTSS